MSTWEYSLLRDELAFLFVRESDYRAFVREVGLGEQHITFTGKAVTDWSNILDEALKKDMVADIIDKAGQQYPRRFILLVAECFYLHNHRTSKIIILPTGLSKSVREIFECHTRVQQTMQLLICWNDTFGALSKSVAGYSVLPEHYQRIQPFIIQLIASLQEGHRLFGNESSFRLAFGVDYYEFIRILVVTDQQLDKLNKKIQDFIRYYNKASMASIALSWDIQQRMVDIAQNLQMIDSLMLMWQQQYLEREVLPAESVNAPETSSAETLSTPSAASAGGGSSHTDTPATLAFPVDVTNVKIAQLRKAIFHFYSESSFRGLCLDLSEEFKDPRIKYDNLSGNNLESKLASFIDFFDRNTNLLELKEYLLKDLKFRKVLYEYSQENNNTSL